MPWCLSLTLALLVAPLPARADPPPVVASLGEDERRGGHRSGASPALPPLARPPLAEPPAEVGRSLLAAGDRADLLLALRWTGVDALALVGGRETTNLGLAEPVDRWRLPSADLALDDPLWLPDRVGHVGVSLDLVPAGTLSGWGPVRTLAGEELGSAPLEGCPVGRPRGLSQLVVGDEAAVRRQESALHTEVGPALDRVAGDLVQQGLVARCHLDRALGGLSRAQRQQVRDHLATLLAAPEGEDPEVAASRAVDLATAWERVDRARLVAAGLAWSEAVRGATLALSELPAGDWPGGPLVVETRLGTVWLGSPGRDLLAGDPALVLDPGGDDHWSVADWRTLADSAWVPPVRGVVELGGSDHYDGGAVALGGALLGLSAGVDRAGDDTWRTGPLSQAGAWFGVATWLDGGGQDGWDGPAAVQGFAGYGLAVLRDTGQGDDLLRADRWAQGAALSGGLGLLLGGEGDDRYLLAGPVGGQGQGWSAGQRPWLGGGLGWLQDAGGDDHYLGGAEVQGSSAWHGLGVLLDLSGDDVYTAEQDAQGSATHRAAAGLFDLAGDDRYSVRAAGQGSGRGHSVSWLLDGAGSDVYTGQDAVQGVAGAQAVALLLDRAGHDLYVAGTGRSHGAVARDGGAGAVAALVDGAGADRYLVAAEGEPTRRPEAAATGHGVALDLVRDEPASHIRRVPTGTALPVPPDPAAARALVLAHFDRPTPTEARAAALAALVSAGPGVVEALLPLASGELEDRSEAVGAVVAHWTHQGSPAARSTVASAVLTSLEAWPQDALDDSVRWHLSWLSGLYAAQPGLAGEALTGADIGRLHPAWTVRREAWGLAADLAAAGPLPRVLRQSWIEAARSTVADGAAPDERAAAMTFLGRVGDGEAARLLAGRLARGTLVERAAAEQGLVELAAAGSATLVLRAVEGLARGGDGPPRDAALRVAGATGLSTGLDLVAMGLGSHDAATRRAAAQGLAAHDSPEARRLATLHGRSESDPRVQAALVTR